MKKHPRGISLLDTLLMVFLTVIIIGIVSDIFIQLLRSYNVYNARTVLLTRTAIATQHIEDTAIASFGVVPTLTVGAVTYTSGPGTVVLKIASLDGGGNPIASTFDHMIYTLDPADPAQLLEIPIVDAASSRPSSTKVLTSDVYGLSFTYRNADPTTTGDLTTALTLKTVVRGEDIVETLQSYARTRNK